jgi:hypothetical protein
MPRFTIRDLLWLTVVMALLCGWAVSHRRTVATWRAQNVELKAWGVWERRVNESLIEQLHAEGRNVTVSAEGTAKLHPTLAGKGQ